MHNTDHQGHGEVFTVQESVELDRLRRENKERPPYADMATIRAWLAGHRLRWAKEGHPDYQDLLKLDGDAAIVPIKPT